MRPGSRSIPSAQALSETLQSPSGTIPAQPRSQKAPNSADQEPSVPFDMNPCGGASAQQATVQALPYTLKNLTRYRPRGAALKESSIRRSSRTIRPLWHEPLRRPASAQHPPVDIPKRGPMHGRPERPLRHEHVPRAPMERTRPLSARQADGYHPPGSAPLSRYRASLGITRPPGAHAPPENRRASPCPTGVLSYDHAV